MKGLKQTKRVSGMVKIRNNLSSGEARAERVLLVCTREEPKLHGNVRKKLGKLDHARDDARISHHIN